MKVIGKGRLGLLPPSAAPEALPTLMDIWNKNRAPLRALALEARTDEVGGLMLSTDALCTENLSLEILDQLDTLLGINRYQFCLMASALPDKLLQLLTDVLDLMGETGPCKIYQATHSHTLFYFVAGKRSLGINILPPEAFDED